MKKNILFTLLCLPFFALAQQESSISKSTDTAKDSLSNKEKFIHKKNAIKLNLSGLALNNYSITYERALSKHFSFSLGYNYIPNGPLPLLDKIQQQINDPNSTLGNVTIGGYAVTPELRWYTGKGLRGFYIAPYARMSSFDLVIPANYTITYKAPITNVNTTQTFNITFEGTMKATSAGLMFGIQERIGPSINLDIWIIGASYSGTTNRLNGIISPALPNADAQTQMEAKLNSIDAGPYKISGKVPTVSTAYVDVTNWYGLRALCVTLGIRF